MTKIRELLAELKAGMEQIYGTRLRGMYLYGSYARGEQQPESDVDILIVLDRIERYGAEIDRTGQLVSTVSLKYGVSVSRVFVPEKDWSSGDNSFLRNVREEATAA